MDGCEFVVCSSGAESFDWVSDAYNTVDDYNEVTKVQNGESYGDEGLFVGKNNCTHAASKYGDKKC